MKHKVKPLDLPRELRTKISGVYNMGRLGSQIRNARLCKWSTRGRQQKKRVGGQGETKKIIKGNRPESKALETVMKNYSYSTTS